MPALMVRRGGAGANGREEDKSGVALVTRGRRHGEKRKGEKVLPGWEGGISKEKSGIG